MNQEQDKKNSQKVTPPSQQQSNSIAIVLYFEIPGVAAVTGDIGLEILKNLSREEPPFKPELGLGGCTWILTAGHPYTGITQNKNVIIPTKVEYADDLEILIFQEEDLQRIFNDKRQIYRYWNKRRYNIMLIFTIYPSINLIEDKKEMLCIVQKQRLKKKCGRKSEDESVPLRKR